MKQDATGDSTSEGEGETASEEPAEEQAEINAIVVSDIDWILPDFFAIRNSGGADFLPATQNVTFILNIIDALAGDERFLEIRKRTRKHRTLAKIDEATREYRMTAQDDQDEFLKEIESKLQDAQTSFEEKIAAVDKIEGLNRNTREQRKEAVRMREQARLQADIKELESDRSRKVKQIRHKMEQEVRGVQDRYKLYALLIPPIPPLLVALYVFFQRRKSEREGIAETRLR